MNYIQLVIKSWRVFELKKYLVELFPIYLFLWGVGRVKARRSSLPPSPLVGKPGGGVLRHYQQCEGGSLAPCHSFHRSCHCLCWNYQHLRQSGWWRDLEGVYLLFVHENQATMMMNSTPLLPHMPNDDTPHPPPPFNFISSCLHIYQCNVHHSCTTHHSILNDSSMQDFDILDTLWNATVCAEQLYIKVYIDLCPHNSTHTPHMSFLLHQAAIEWRRNHLEKISRFAEPLKVELEDEDCRARGCTNQINLSTLSDAEWMEQFQCSSFLCQCVFHAA